MRRARFVLFLALCGIPAHPCAARPAPTPTPRPAGPCLNAARARAASALGKGVSREAARLELEIASALCFDPSLKPATAHLIGTVNADRARFARDFLEGKLTLAAYGAALEDRRRKLERLLRDPKGQRALSAGDSDGDLVPDRLDRCPATPFGTPTDDRGCPVRPPSHPAENQDESGLRATLAGARFLYNKSCDGAARPGIPGPLEWGRGAQTKHGTMGFNIAVSKVHGQPAGCEVFYEIQFRFFDGGPAVPPSQIVTVVYSESEDLLTNPERAVFGLPIGPVLSPARDTVLEDFNRHYARATWRVRAVNGSNLPSPWSPFITQGAASSGVHG